MDPARWDRIQNVFHDALDLPADERRAFVVRVAGADTDLAGRVLELLAADAGTTFLDRDVGGVARDVLDDAPAAAIGVGLRVGPYRLTQALGEGGTGVVYLATRDDIGHEVAIKILRDAWVSEQRRERFLREQRLLAKLNHPAIARIFDAGVLEGGTPWFAMERVDGVPLDDYCRAGARDRAEIVRLVREVAAAVQHAHERLIVHRDLKPSNVAVTRTGQPKLLDFGIARQLEDGTGNAGHTGVLRLLTPGYASPEERRGEPPGVRSDVFSLGVILRDLLAAASDAGPARHGWLSALAHRFDRTAAGDLEVICRTATQDDPSLRYPTAEALVRDLDAWLAGRPLAARPASSAYRARRFVSRNRRALSAAALLVTVLSGVGTTYAVRLAAARAATLAEAARSERLLRFMLDLFAGGERDGVASAELRVVSMLERGVREAEQLRDDPRAQSELFGTLGRAYLDLGETPQAERLLSDALAIRRARVAEQPANTVRALAAMSDVRLAQQRYDDALTLALEAVELATRSIARDDRALLVARTSLGRTQQEKGDYKSSAGTLEGALSGLDERPELDRERATALAVLSDTQFYLGDMAGAEQAARQAIAITQRARGPRHADVGHMTINLGAIAFTQGRFPESEQHYRAAVEIFEGWYGKDNPETASALTSLGQAVNRMDRHGEAVELLDRALAIQTRVYGPVHRRTAYVQNELGLVAMRMRDLSKAEAAFEQAIAGYRTDEATRFQLGVSMVNLATVYLTRGELPRAEGMFEQALAVYAKTLPPDHMRIGIARGRLGRTLLRAGRYAEARHALLEAERVLATQPDPQWVMEVRDDLAKLPAS
jgi:eukaryotic-like serine/threonine-protein kinase